VLKDPALNVDEKREVLASWASDASSVREEPSLRWLLGTPEPVALADVREALLKLDLWEATAASLRPSEMDRPQNIRLS
jgi:hypothetical protein